MYEYNLAIRFQSVASQYEDRTAIWFSDDEHITYAELNRLANRIARFMIERGVKRRKRRCDCGRKILPNICVDDCQPETRLPLRDARP